LRSGVVCFDGARGGMARPERSIFMVRPASATAGGRAVLRDASATSSGADAAVAASFGTVALAVGVSLTMMMPLSKVTAPKGAGRGVGGEAVGDAAE